MATSGLYGNSGTGSLIAQPGSETSGLYGNTVNFGGTVFEWFIFRESATQPATPTGGSWNFVTNVGTPPAGWTASPPTAPTNEIWVSIAFINSRAPATIVWSVPGLLGVVPSTTVGTTTTGAAGTSASVTNSGTAIDAVLNFTIPQGSTGATGATGTAATIAAGTTTTTAPGTNATVTNVGTSAAAIFDFGIPRGAGVITGGTAGQYLAKASSTDYDTVWSTITGTLSYQGAWNASTNTPTLTSSVGTNGYYYVVSVAGSTNLNGITDWQIGDWAIFNGSIWQKIDQTNLVTSVNGQTGAVSLTAANVGALASIASADGSIVVTTVGTAVDLSVSTTSPASVLLEQVRNTTGATLTKGTAVYISGATGQLPTVSKALATSDATSAQTLGLITSDLPNNSNGFVTIIGLVTNLDTSAYTDGQQLYLSPITAGTLTATKPYAPQHLVYMAVVAHAHPTQGKLIVKVQNGYELDELHNVSAQSPSNGQTIVYNATTSLWEKANLTAGTGISVTNGAGSITVANTGVTSVTATSPVVSSGGATPAISLAATYGDTLNPYGSKAANLVLASPNLAAGLPTFRAIVATDVPTLNQNTTGSAATLTTPRAIYGNNFDGSAALTQIIASTYGGTGNGFTKFTGPTTAERTFTLPDANSTIVVQGGALGTPSSGTVTNLTGTASININGTVGATTANTGAFTTLTATADSTFSSTGALTISKGTTGQRPTATSGMLRFNTTTTEFEGYNGTTWASVGGAALSNDTSTATNVYPLFANATTGTASTLFTGNAKLLYKPSTGEFQMSAPVASNGIVVNSLTVATSYTIAAGFSGASAGPITIASGQSVTVAGGSRWVIS